MDRAAKVPPKEFTIILGTQIFHNFIHRAYVRFSTTGCNNYHDFVKNLKYFLLDFKIFGCKIASQSRLLTGVLTDTKRWNGGGDASFDSNRSGKSVACTLGVEAERFSRGFFGILGCPDKNG